MPQIKSIKIAPSIASGPLTNLQQTMLDLEGAGADVIHFDVEDGSFVPVMNLGVKAIQELRNHTTLPFDVHLMMVNPEWLISDLADMGVDHLSVHFEACPYPRRTLRLISEQGMKAGLAFNPATELPDLKFCLPYLSFIVILTTDPEHEACPFLPSVLNKVAEGKKRDSLAKVTWVVDGGIDETNAALAQNAGADMLVIGRAIYKHGAISQNIQKIRDSLK